jgi:hypothetical protein
MATPSSSSSQGDGKDKTAATRVSTLKHCMKCGSLLVDRRDEDNHMRRVCSSSSCDWIFYNNPVPVVAGITLTFHATTLHHLAYNNNNNE